MKHRPMDCEEALEYLYDYLDGELDSDTSRQVKDHLEACARCFKRFGFEKAYLLFLEARARSKGAPETVRRKILDSLLKENGD